MVNKKRMKRAPESESTCSFCGANAVPVVRQDVAGIANLASKTPAQLLTRRVRHRSFGSNSPTVATRTRRNVE